MLTLYLAMIDSEQDRLRFEDIYDSYSKQMYHVAKGIVTDTQLAEDAVQDALLRIARNISTINTFHPKVVRAYVLTAAKNAAINILKKQKRETSNVIAYEDISCDDNADISKIMETTETMEDVKSVMKRLPLMYREVLMLRYVNGMAYSEIAQLLGRSQSTIRQQIVRAKKKLVALCEKEGICCEV